MLTDNQKNQINEVNQYNISEIIKMKQAVSVVPTYIPTKFLDQFVFYVNGSVKRLYIYINNAWENFDLGPIENLLAENIKNGITIKDVLGTFPNDGDAVAGDVLLGKTFYSNNAAKKTGTISSKGAQTYTPGTSNQVISAGQHLSGDQTILGDADLIASNIKAGINIFGVDGIYANDSVELQANFTEGLLVGYYYRIGKVYFGFHGIWNTSNKLFLSGDTDSIDRIASLIGITVSSSVNGEAKGDYVYYDILETQWKWVGNNNFSPLLYIIAA